MQCSGQDSRFWNPETIFEVKCPKCGHGVEFFKDDPSRKCGKCGHRFPNPKIDFGCASHCEYASQCMGFLSPELIQQKENLLKDQVIFEMKKHFKQDAKKISHAMRTAHYAEKIGKNEGCNLSVILISAYLHNTDEQDADNIAKSILTNLKANEALIDEVCSIINNLNHRRKDENINFKTLYDSTLLANMEEGQQDINSDELARMVNLFITKSGRKEAESAFSHF